MMRNVSEDRDLQLAAAIDNTQLTEADWNDVCQAVSGISADWKALARHLGLDANRIDTIARENPSSMDECLSQALKHWLRCNNSLRRNIRPSWRTLAEAVKPLNGSLFTDIKKAHPQPTISRGSSSCVSRLTQGYSPKTLVVVITIVAAGVAIAVSLRFTSCHKDGAAPPTIHKPAANIGPQNVPNQESTTTEVPSLDPSLNFNKPCHEIFTNDCAELAEIIGSHGSAKQWCTSLMISESTCNRLDYSRQHQDDIVLDVAKAFLNEKLNPCWEDIVHVLCKSLKKNRAALKLSEKHSVSYSSQCG